MPVNKYLIKDGSEIKKYKEEAGLPIMTDWNQPSPYQVTQSNAGTYPGTNFNSAGYQAFDGESNNLDGMGSSYWMTSTGTTSAFIEIRLGTAGPKVYTGYSVTSHDEATAPKSFAFYGSVDGATWVKLDERLNEVNWVGKEKRNYSFTNSNGYSYFKFDVTANNGGDFLAVEHFQLGTKGWQTIGTAPVTKAMFDSGMTDLSLLTKETISQLTSTQPEVLVWTDEAPSADGSKTLSSSGSTPAGTENMIRATVNQSDYYYKIKSIK